ncbi:MAG TPA: DUF72 domain-containing protein [Sedimentisphaerales bacterium]|nr:DUF72 domain-containing protein [Sedimentisphaerales bacterium]
MGKAGCDIRFHGTTGRYGGSYTDRMLADWANWIKQNKNSVTAIYAYFNNDAEAHAIDDARNLHEAVVKQGC